MNILEVAHTRTMGGCFSGLAPTVRARQPSASELTADPRQALVSASAPPLQSAGVALPIGSPPDGPSVATIVVPGEEDVRKFISRGGLEIEWTKARGTTVKTRRLTERPIRRVLEPGFSLPTLYLHFLDTAFVPDPNELDWSLRSGNDNESVNIVLPHMFTSKGLMGQFEGALAEDLAIVIQFLESVGEAVVSTPSQMPGAWGPANYKVAAAPTRYWFSLKTARPKAPISLDKAAFGIPLNADLYVFAQNHPSVAFLDERHRRAFENCITELPNRTKAWASLSSFLKLFYEGGFAYNKKIHVSKGYIPETVGIACMSVTPAFDGQLGINTGDPYLVDARFMPFVDTVPVTIRAISDMSSKHQRYGLCFTRSILVWEPEDFATTGSLHYALLCPHGGFFYTPSTLGDYWHEGCLVYAFGEDKSQAAGDDVPLVLHA